MNFDDFSEWMLDHNYGPQTAKATARAIARSEERLADGDADFPVGDIAAIRRYLTYCESTHRTRNTLCKELRDLGYSGLDRTPAAKPKERLREARSYSDADWAKLKAAVSQSAEPEDEVLYAIMATGLRVGDVLRVDRATLRAGLRTGILNLARKGGKIQPIPITDPLPWARIARGCRQTDECTNIASYVAPGYPDDSVDGAAYKRVRRRLQKLHKALGLSGRAHTHKLRRTKAVQALKATDNTVAVQQMLGHASHNSTLRYLDEPQLESVAALQRKLEQRGR